jgi:hypothetical protein
MPIPYTLDHAYDQLEDDFEAIHPDMTVVSLGKEYLKMKMRFRALGMLIPVLLADVTSLLYSKKEWERKFMVKFWELLHIYSKGGPIDRSDHDYPNRFFKEDGPVPILIASGINLPFAVSIPRPRGRGLGAFRWSDDEYRYAILGMRAVSQFLSERVFAE